MSDNERAAALLINYGIRPGTMSADLEAAFAAVRADEREECARIADREAIDFCACDQDARIRIVAQRIRQRKIAAE